MSRQSQYVAGQAGFGQKFAGGVAVGDVQGRVHSAPPIHGDVNFEDYYTGEKWPGGKVLAIGLGSK